MKKSRAEWEEAVERQAESGLSQAMYAKREGLSLSSFHYWRQKFLKESRAEQRAFLEVPGPVEGSGEIELELPHGIVLRIRGS